MAHVVTERCVKCRYTDCCTVCPVDCFYEIVEPAMLVIDPDTCIDCGLCVPACPIAAIWPIDELPDAYQDWTDRNASLFSSGTKIKIKKDPLPGALTLSQLQAREQQRGWSITEPSGAGEHAGGGEDTAVTTTAGTSISEEDVLNALSAGRFRWRTARGISQELGAPPDAVQAEIEKLIAAGHVRRSPATNPKAPPVFGAVAKVGAA
jgi:ferredoxin